MERGLGDIELSKVRAINGGWDSSPGLSDSKSVVFNHCVILIIELGGIMNRIAYLQTHMYNISSRLI